MDAKKEKGVVELCGEISALINKKNKEYDFTCGDIIQTLCILTADITDWIANSLSEAGETQETLIDHVHTLTRSLVKSVKDSE